MEVVAVCILCTVVAVAAMVCILMARAMWRAGAREAVLDADLAHDNPNLTYNLDQMDVGTNKLFDILNTILDMGKVESGKMQLEEVEFKMTDVLEESMDLANVIGMSRGIEVIWDPCDFSVLRCTATIGDYKRVKQILDNLLGNAIKFTHEGHVMLRAWANRPIIRRSMISTPTRFAPHRRRGGVFRWLLGRREKCNEHNGCMFLQNDPNSVEFYFEVVDTGVGIPKEKRESVFENYVQVKEGHGGTGLGLGIVQSFVRLMGGEINIMDKEPGEAGTCFGFNVFLKVSETPEVEEDIEQGRTPPSLFSEPACFKGGHCVLLVHGNETRRILHTWMESVGMKVWPVPHTGLLASILDKACVAGGASPSRAALMSPLHGVGGGDIDCTTDRCFSSKEMVRHLQNSGGMAGNHGGHAHPFGLLVIVDVSSGMLHEVAREAASLARIRHQAPCRVVCLTDLKTPSQDLRRFKEAAMCDLDLRKPIHGSRLHKLLQVMRDLQASPFQQQHPYQFGTELPAEDQTSRAAPEITSETPALLGLADGRPLEGMRVLLAEDTPVLQMFQKQVLTSLGAAVDIATDGSMAVAMFTKALEDANGVPESHVDTVIRPYDVIFMDCQFDTTYLTDSLRARPEEVHKRLEQQLRLHLQSVRDRPLVLTRGAGEVQSVQIVSQFFRACARSCHGTISAHAAAIPAGIGATVGVDAMFENSRSAAVHARQ
ncbi:probable histidine kinase 2 [Aegilops tauschii subsp. strangulata]|uniref:probable histidine kinase 2 n=1 Tax=Triticum aestivum TaxID=4565 RepID=UPI001D00E6D2|nr:probable histidine kinase 2 [Triticum aestivum]